jgi:hypothetical protein
MLKKDFKIMLDVGLPLPPRRQDKVEGKMKKADAKAWYFDFEIVAMNVFY